MLKRCLFLVFLSFLLGCPMSSEDIGSGGLSVSGRIRLNTIGFLPDAEKKASFAGSCTSFFIINGTNTNDVVYTGNNISTVYNNDTKENLTILDFSDFTTEGEYSIYIEGAGLSPLFKIGVDVYNEPFKVCMMGMYLWRCGTNVSYTYKGVTYSHAVCHKNDGNLYYINNSQTTKDGTGGWHDAGDYNKYVVNAGVTVGVMFLGWEHFKDMIQNISLDIPEKNNSIPDYLDEIKWEIEWLLKMEYPDGSGRVSHKLSTLNFGGFIMPEAETTTRYFCPFSTAATADFVAMLAMAARIFAPYDTNFTNQCIQAAKRAYNFLKNNPTNIQPADSAFSTGGYKTDDKDDRLWAAAEMWVTLGDSEYLTDFETRAGEEQNKIDIDFDWSTVKNIGMISYLFSTRSGKNQTLVNNISNSLINVANQIISNRNKHGYGRPLGESYYWGCNGSVARQVVILHSAYKLTNNADYKATALDAISHLFGRNYYGRSFVTGLGYNPPKYPHDRTSGASKKAWPGRLVGGGWPLATSWVDVESNYEVNEIAINWNAALIYALGWFLN
ncbi:MAG: glycoside hydrolase family 9 protein [Brevinematales bacterium]